MRQATTTYYTQQAKSTYNMQQAMVVYQMQSRHNHLLYGHVSDAGATGRGQKGSPTYSRWYSDAGAPGRGQESSTTTIKPQAEVVTECYRSR